ncbi:hypothetical protein F2P47_14095 [Parvibaculum sedimenti]|uniref:DUF2178 domain-containing protein n=1 Tax=Parvibaculum sedimenti TaxID=2608632 RepID=A0A6N6VJM9_9HYPH|nr:hypothetical protein [Parvibaculum sedimenti]KAB7739136.1 hypothetical protein F2P47_14095 [Parvibaculum sedimenti]
MNVKWQMSKPLRYILAALICGLFLFRAYYLEGLEAFVILLAIFGAFGIWTAYRAYRGIQPQEFPSFSRAEKIRIWGVGAPALILWLVVHSVPTWRTPLIDFPTAVLLLAAVFYLRPLRRKLQDAMKPQPKQDDD